MLFYNYGRVCVQSAEELERLTVDECLEPVERAVYLLRLADILSHHFNIIWLSAHLHCDRLLLHSPRLSVVCLSVCTMSDLEN